jgi:hypothetical protein
VTNRMKAEQNGKIMKRSTLMTGTAALISGPGWLLPEAGQTLGTNVFLGLTALSIAGGLIGLATWYFDCEPD